MAVPTFDTADWALQQAMYAALDAALSVPVVDYYDGEDLPVVVIGDMVDTPWSTQTTRGQDITARVRAISSGRGMKEVALLKTTIVSTLDNERFDLSADGFKVAHAQVIGGNTIRLPEEDRGRVVRQANIDVRYLITNT